MDVVQPFSLFDILTDNAPLIGDCDISSFKTPIKVTATCELNENYPEWVKRYYHQVAGAGSQFTRTNSANANQFELAKINKSDRCESINNMSLMLAKEAIGEQLYFAGLINQVNPKITDPLKIENLYGEQVIYLSDIGANFIWYQGFNNLSSAETALKITKRNTPKESFFHFETDHIQSKEAQLKVLKSLEKLLKQKAEFVGFSVHCQNETGLNLILQAIEEFGVISVILDEFKKTKTPSKAFKQTVTQLFKRECALLTAGKNTTINHIKQCVQIKDHIFQ